MTVSSPTPADIAFTRVQALMDRGYILFPCHGKIPAVKGWREVTPGQYSAQDLARGNYGVALSPTDLVIDVDPRNFKEGDRPLARLIAAIGVPLQSFRVKSGGGGVHIYLKMPAGTAVVAKMADFQGIDIKTHGGYVIGPGSVHPTTGAVYEVIDPLAEVIDAPEALLSLIRRPVVEWEKTGTGEYKDDEATKERYIEFLRTAEPSVQGQSGDKHTFAVACRARDLGLSPAVAFQAILSTFNDRCSPPWTAEQLQEKVQNAYKYAHGEIGNAHPAADFEKVKVEEPEAPLKWVERRGGGLCLNFVNLLNYLRLPETGLHKVFGYNEFTNRVEFVNPAPWHKGLFPAGQGRALDDDDLKMLKAHLAQNHKFEMPIQTLEEAIVVTAKRISFHPVREYLDSLKWDGKPRLDTWLTEYAGVEDSGYTRACARKTLCAAVLRVFKPGIKFDHVLVLEGDQGVGKSSVCRILGGSWSADFPVDPRNKETVQLMQGAWVIELAELEVQSRAETDAIKAFLSRETDKIRVVYGRLPREFPRQSIFIATKNPSGDGTYLKDDTGNRRWWPVLCCPRGGQADFKGLKEARNQLFAEAVHMVKTKGEKLYMDTAELKDATKTEVAARHAEHSWTEEVRLWLKQKKEVPDFLTGRDIYCGAMQGAAVKFTRREELAIASVMRSLGWIRAVRRAGDKPVRGYVPPMEPDAKKAAEMLGDLI